MYWNKFFYFNVARLLHRSIYIVMWNVNTAPFVYSSLASWKINLTSKYFARPLRLGAGNVPSLQTDSIANRSAVAPLNWADGSHMSSPPVQMCAAPHPESTSPAAAAGGPSAGCRRSWAPGCCPRWEAGWRCAWSSSCFWIVCERGQTLTQIVVQWQDTNSTSGKESNSIVAAYLDHLTKGEIDATHCS